MKINSYVAPQNGITENGNNTNQSGKLLSGKFQERMDSGEKVNLFREMKDSVIVEFSDEAIAKLNEGILDVKNEGSLLPSLSYEEKIRLLQEEIKPAQKLHRLIPNIRTNDMLQRSLQGADQAIVDAAYSIIEDSLLPHNVGDLTEEERRELIYIGLEEAKYLADAMDEEHAKLFMDAMNTIAKYGLNGEMDEQGNVNYDIRWGAMWNAPDDYITTGELMKEIAPHKYREYQGMLNEAFANHDKGLFADAAKFAIDWENDAYRNRAKEIEALKKELLHWQNNIDNTVMENRYQSTNYSDMQSFMDSILEQNKTLNRDFLQKHLQKFAEIFSA